MNKTGIFRVLNIIKNIVCWTLIVCLVAMVVIFLTARVNGETPQIFGYSILRVSSGSMEPELSVGDVILDHVVDEPKTLKVGDVITFNGSGQLSGMLVTHKIIKAPYLEDGKLMLQTRGIANEIADEPIRADDVRGIMLCKLPMFNVLYNIFLSPWGLLILIALIILVFIDEIVTIIKILTGNVEIEQPESINDIIDRIQADKAQTELNQGESENAEKNLPETACDSPGDEPSFADNEQNTAQS